MKFRNDSKYFFCIIVIIASHMFGELFAPFTVPRLISLALLPRILLNIKYLYYKLPGYLWLFFAVWFAVSIVSLIWSTDRVNGIKFLIYNFLSLNLFLSLLYFSLKCQHSKKAIILGWILMLWGTFPVAFWEFLSFNHLPISYTDTMLLKDSTSEVIQRSFASVTYGNLNTYNIMILFALPFILYGIIQRQDLKRTSMLTLFILTCIVLWNSSRGAILCLALGILIILYYCFNKGINRKLVYSFVYLLVVVIAINIEILLHQIISRLVMGEGLTQDTSRLNIYANCISVLNEYYGLGSGIGGLSAALTDISVNDIAAPHNFFLEFLCQYGIFPTIFFIYMWYRIIAQLLRNESTKIIGIIIIIILVPLAIINAVYLTFTAFWIFIASLFVLGKITPTNKAVNSL